MKQKPASPLRFSSAWVFSRGVLSLFCPKWCGGPVNPVPADCCLQSAASRQQVAMRVVEVHAELAAGAAGGAADSGGGAGLAGARVSVPSTRPWRAREVPSGLA